MVGMAGQQPEWPNNQWLNRETETSAEPTTTTGAPPTLQCFSMRVNIFVISLTMNPISFIIANPIFIFILSSFTLTLKHTTPFGDHEGDPPLETEICGCVGPND